MTAIYAIAITGGAIGLIAAIALSLNPARPDLPAAGRHGVLGTLGFGLGGMSSSFGGWPAALAVLAAVGGAAILIALGVRYGPVGDE